MNTGKIIKGVGGLYKIAANNEIFECRARGSFRHDGITVLVGDNVIFENGYILDICERKNSTVRPPMANLDLLFICLSPKKPLPVLFTVDKLTSVCAFCNIEPVIVITKEDLSQKETERIRDIYEKSGFLVFCVSEQKDKSELLNFIKQKCKDKTCAFCGASGVGKSTLINSLFPELELQTGDVSIKTQRGKQTTRHIELYPLNKLLSVDCSGYIADTPGFSMLDASLYDGYDKENLVCTFTDFKKYIGKCKYVKCTHTKEEGCAILDGMANGDFSATRHESYLALYEQLKNKHFWDK